MKIVKESLNEIRKGEKSGLSSLGIGKLDMIKRWANQHFDEYKIIDDVIYPNDVEEYPSVKWVLSGKIPDYIKIIANKPYELLELGDVVINHNESTQNEYFIEELFDDTKSQKYAVVKAYGETTYNTYKEHMDKGVKVIRTTQYDKITHQISWQIQLYDYIYGVMGTFIYNEEKI